jgi:predicted DNA-binding protein
MPTFTMRMPDKDYSTLQAMALLTGKSMAELVREAIIEMVARYVASDDIERKIDEEAAQRKAALELVRSNVAEG